MRNDDLRGLNRLSIEFHSTSSKAGWWQDLTGPAIAALPAWAQKVIRSATVGTKIALIHSEISEALEGVRKNSQDSHLPHRKAVEVELADALIRIFDLAGYLKLDLAGAVEEKAAYNLQRADHKAEARNAAGGKQF